MSRGQEQDDYYSLGIRSTFVRLKTGTYMYGMHGGLAPAKASL